MSIAKSPVATVEWWLLTIWSTPKTWGCYTHWIAQLHHCIMDLQTMEVPDHANTHPIPMIVAEISQFFWDAIVWSEYAHSTTKPWLRENCQINPSRISSPSTSEAIALSRCQGAKKRAKIAANHHIGGSAKPIFIVDESTIDGKRCRYMCCRVNARLFSWWIH